MQVRHYSKRVKSSFICLPHTNHPDQQNNKYHKHYSTSNATHNVCKFTLLRAVGTSEGPSTSARWISSDVLHTNSLIFTEASTDICTNSAGSIVSWLAFTLEITGFRQKQAVCIGIAVHFYSVHFTWIRAVFLAYLFTKI